MTWSIFKIEYIKYKKIDFYSKYWSFCSGCKSSTHLSLSYQGGGPIKKEKLSPRGTFLGLRSHAIPRVLHGVHLLKYQPFIESNTSKIDTSFKPCQLSMCSFNFTFLFQQFSFSFHFFKISVSPALFHSTKPIWDTHGQTSVVATSSHQVPCRHHLQKFMLVWPSPLLKCLSLFSCSLKLSHGRASPCSHHLRVTATTSIELTVSLGGFVNAISEPLSPNSPLSVIIFRKKSLFIFYFLFFSVFWC